MTLDELKRENEILKDALCLEQDRLSFARYHLENAQNRIKRLEEAGDLMREWLANSRNLGADPFLSELWRKAKEDKP